MAALHNTAFAGRLWLANNIQCSVPRAPLISVVPTTDDIVYDFSQSTADLSRQKSQTVSPYAPGVDTATGGLRVDHPEIRLEVHWGYAQYTPEQVVCMWYDHVNVTIALKPHIFVARDFGAGPCRDAILTHERRHVEVDHQIVNHYSETIGDAIKAAVDAAGPLGPYPVSQLDEIGKVMVAHVHAALDTQDVMMQEDERKLQTQVDSLDEYQRISNICHNSKPGGI